MANKQLYEKLGQNNYDKIFPLTYLENIIERDTDNTLTVVLSRFNHLYIPYQGTATNTRKAVPTIFRRNGLVISYYDAERNISVTEKFAGTNLEAGTEVGWTKESNWSKVLDEKYLEEAGATIPIRDNTITLDMLESSLRKLLLAENGTTVINYPDEEDITVSSTPGCCQVDRLKLKDRPYIPDYKTGKGYKILRRNLLPVEDRNARFLHYGFHGILDESYCELNGAININPEKYQVSFSDLYLTRSAGIYYDTTHHLFVLRVLFTDDVKPYYNYYSQWKFVDFDEESSYSVLYTGNSYDYNMWNACLADEYPILNRIFVDSSNDFVNYQYKDGELVQVVNDVYIHYKNVITQEDLNEANTRYIVRYDFDLNGANIVMPPGCELVFEGGVFMNGTIDLNGCKLAGMIGPESDYFGGVNLSNWAKGQIEYRDGKICYWNGTEWRIMGDTADNESYSKTEINNMLGNYYTKQQTYNKQEINNLLSDYVTNDTFNEYKNQVNDLVTNSVNLDKIQKAINDGCGVNMTMPSSNSNKISLPIWTGTATEYAAITPVDGMTYNIVD